jgi:hypothetical protein
MATDSQKLDRILSILENDPNTNTKGLVEQVRDLNKDVNSLLIWKKELTFKAGLFAFIGTAIINLFVWIFNIYKK